MTYNHTMERIKGKHHTMEIVENDEGFEGLIFCEDSTSDYMDTPEWCSGRSTDKLAVIRDTVEALMNHEEWAAAEQRSRELDEIMIRHGR